MGCGRSRTAGTSGQCKGKFVRHSQKTIERDKHTCRGVANDVNGVAPTRVVRQQLVACGNAWRRVCAVDVEVAAALGAINPREREVVPVAGHHVAAHVRLPEGVLQKHGLLVGVIN